VFLFDDILLSPVKGFLFIAERVREAALESQQAEAAALTKQLSSLYTRLESGEITEDEFDGLEEEILDRLESLKGDEDDEGPEEDDGTGFTISLLDDDEERAA